MIDGGRNFVLSSLCRMTNSFIITSPDFAPNVPAGSTAGKTEPGHLHFHCLRNPMNHTTNERDLILNLYYSYLRESIGSRFAAFHAG